MNNDNGRTKKISTSEVNAVAGKDVIMGHTASIFTGLKQIDNLTGGFRLGDLIVLAGRPAMGKTLLAFNIALHVSMEMNKAVAIFSGAMPNDEVAMNLLCNVAGLNIHKVKRGDLAKCDWTAAAKAAQVLSKTPLFLKKMSDVSLNEIESMIRGMREEGAALSLIIIDYIQLMKTTGTLGTRQEDIESIATRLKDMARDFNVPVILISQLQPRCDDRENKRPKLVDIMPIDKYADVVIFLHREDMYKNNTAISDITEINVVKNSQGAIGTVHLKLLTIV